MRFPLCRSAAMAHVLCLCHGAPWRNTCVFLSATVLPWRMHCGSAVVRRGGIHAFSSLPQHCRGACAVPQWKTCIFLSTAVLPWHMHCGSAMVHRGGIHTFSSLLQHCCGAHAEALPWCTMVEYMRFPLYRSAAMVCMPWLCRGAPWWNTCVFLSAAAPPWRMCCGPAMVRHGGIHAFSSPLQRCHGARTMAVTVCHGGIHAFSSLPWLCCGAYAMAQPWLCRHAPQRNTCIFLSVMVLSWHPMEYCIFLSAAVLLWHVCHGVLRWNTCIFLSAAALLWHACCGSAVALPWRTAAEYMHFPLRRGAAVVYVPCHAAAEYMHFSIRCGAAVVCMPCLCHGAPRRNTHVSSPPQRCRGMHAVALPWHAAAEYTRFPLCHGAARRKNAFF